MLGELSLSAAAVGVLASATASVDDVPLQEVVLRAMRLRSSEEADIANLFM